MTVPSVFFALVSGVRSSSWAAMVARPMALAPELSSRSGGLPPTKRGCSSWAIWVEGDTVSLPPSCRSAYLAAAKET